MELKFYKYQGAGNDFVMIDNRLLTFPAGDSKLVAQLCHRRFGIGADGLILLQKHKDHHFEMVYFNADGRPSSMCGNGGRCIAAFARDLDFTQTELDFLAVDGPHIANFDGENVSLQMQNVSKIDRREDGVFVLNTGSPHYVKFVSGVDDLDILPEAYKIRYNSEFGHDGINVNFVQETGKGRIKVRTYERGVEDETYSCGTGVVASAISYYMKHFSNQSYMRPEVEISTKGGKLKVKFSASEDQQFTDVWLIGSAIKVFEGTIEV